MESGEKILSKSYIQDEFFTKSAQLISEILHTEPLIKVPTEFKKL